MKIEDSGEDVKGKRETEKGKEGEKEGGRGRRKRDERMREEVGSQRQTAPPQAVLYTLEQPRRGGPGLQPWRESPQVSKRLGRGWGRDVVAPRPQEACKHCFSPVSSPMPPLDLPCLRPKHTPSSRRATNAINKTHS